MAKNTARAEDTYTTAHVRALTLLEDLHQIVEDMPAPDTCLLYTSDAADE